MKYSLESAAPSNRTKTVFIFKKLTALKISSVPFNKMAIEKFLPLFLSCSVSLFRAEQQQAKETKILGKIKLNFQILSVWKNWKPTAQFSVIFFRRFSSKNFSNIELFLRFVRKNFFFFFIFSFAARFRLHTQRQMIGRNSATYLSIHHSLVRE